MRRFLFSQDQDSLGGQEWGQADKQLHEGSLTQGQSWAVGAHNLGSFSTSLHIFVQSWFRDMSATAWGKRGKEACLPEPPNNALIHSTNLPLSRPCPPYGEDGEDGDHLTSAYPSGRPGTSGALLCRLCIAQCTFRATVQSSPAVGAGGGDGSLSSYPNMSPNPFSPSHVSSHITPVSQGYPADPPLTRIWSGLGWLYGNGDKENNSKVY